MHKENWGHSKSGVSAYRIGAEFEYYPPGLDNKWSLFLDPNYQILKHEFEYREVYLSQNPKFNWKITNNLFEVPLGVRYHMYFNKSTKVFVNAAYNFYAISGSSNAIFQRRELYTTANDIDETMDIKTPARFGLGGRGKL